MDKVPVEYGTFSQTFYLTMWFFRFITGITFKWDYVIGCSVALLVWIGLLKKLIVYRVPPDPDSGLAEVLDFYGDHSYWIVCYGPRII